MRKGGGGEIRKKTTTQDDTQGDFSIGRKEGAARGAPKGLAKAPKPDIGADDDAEGNPKVPAPAVPCKPPLL